MSKEQDAKYAELMKPFTDKAAIAKRKEEKEANNFLAKQMLKEIFPNSMSAYPSGHSVLFEKFVKLAEKIRSGAI